MTATDSVAVEGGSRIARIRSFGMASVWTAPTDARMASSSSPVTPEKNVTMKGRVAASGVGVGLGMGAGVGVGDGPESGVGATAVSGVGMTSGVGIGFGVDVELGAGAA